MNKLKALMLSGAAVALFTSLTGCASTPSYETRMHERDDAVVTTKVKAALYDEPSLRPYQIGVSTYEGVVQLSGFVASREAADKAEEIAEEVDGVDEVKNDIIVK